MNDMPEEMQFQRIVDRRDQLLREVEALKNKIAGLDIAIGLIGEMPVHREPAAQGQPKVRVTETIVSLLREAGEVGLKPTAAIERAAERGISLNRGSVYSLLNRMMRNGAVVYQDGCYKLAELGHRRERTGIFLAGAASGAPSN